MLIEMRILAMEKTSVKLGGAYFIYQVTDLISKIFLGKCYRAVTITVA
jgi:hypothetical protein